MTANSLSSSSRPSDLRRRGGLALWLALALAGLPGQGPSSGPSVRAQQPSPEPLPSATPLPDLILDGRSTTLSGDQRFGEVRLSNRARIEIRAYGGSEDSGRLQIRAQRIVLETGTQILGDARGFRGQALREGEGPGHGAGGARSIDGGGGGAYGGDGGDGVIDNAPQTASEGGRSYGSPCSLEIERGSAGGAPGVADGDAETARGGHGGAALALIADEIILAGTLSFSGENGYVSANDAGGGGAGGGVLIQAGRLDLSGRIIADGGDGGETDDGGGGGGGGRIKVFYVSGTVRRAGLSVDGGQGDGNGANNDGRRGSICIDLRTPTPSPAVSPSPTDTSTPEPSATSTPSATPTASDTPTPEPSATATATASATPTPTASATPTPLPRPLYLPLLLRESCPDAKDDPVALVLVLDASSSMAEPAGPGRTRLDEAKAAAGLAIARVRAPHRVALIAFDAEARLLAELRSDAAGLHQALGALKPGRGSRIDAGLALAAEVLDQVATPGARRVVLVSDGRVSPSTPEDVLAQAARLRAMGVVIDAVTWQGTDGDLALMAGLAQAPDRLHVAPGPEHLAAIFAGLDWLPPPCGGLRLWPRSEAAPLAAARP